MQTSGADQILTRLVEEGTAVVFLVPGAQIDPLCRRLSETPAPQAIVASHELSAGFMADGYARASGQVGVCLGIGACGAANMLPAVEVAAIDCSPVLFLSGNIPNRLQGHGAFQDGWAQGSDDSRVFRDFVRYSGSPKTSLEVRDDLDRTFATIRKPFASPVHLSIPVDLQEECVPNSRLGFSKESRSRPDDLVRIADNDFDSDRIATALAQAKRPCLLVGPRFCGPDARTLLREFAKRFVIPVATTLSAKGVLPEDHPLSLGNFGFSGSRRALETLLGDKPDLILALGADFNERDSCCWDSRLRTNGRRILRVDSAEFDSQRFPADVECDSDCVELVRDWMCDRGELLGPLLGSADDRTEWVETLSHVPRTFPPAEVTPSEAGIIQLDHVVNSLRESAASDAILTVDAGFQRIFAGHYWQATRPDTFYSACGTAPIGWAICAAIGIQLARTEQPVIVLTGDGCMTAHGMELATMVRYRLPIVVVVCNNGAHGSVAGRLPDSELAQLPDVDWVAFARSMGATGIRVRGGSQLDNTLPEVFEDAMKLARQSCCPVVLDVLTPVTPVLPSADIARSALSKPVSSQDSIAA